METLWPNDLARMMERSFERVEEQKEAINKINVFPVPDQDTGSNLAATLKGVRDAVRDKEFFNFENLAAIALDAALSSAQGNEGVIVTGFLAGFFATLRGQSIGAKTFAQAFGEGAARARQSVQNPREGTVLDVIDAAAGSLDGPESGSDIAQNLIDAVKKAQTALAATRQKIEVLKRANVVDAGGLGFLVMLQAFLEALDFGHREAVKFSGAKGVASVIRLEPVADHRYEVAALLAESAGKILDEGLAKEKLKNLGDFIDVVKIGNKMRVHVHTDQPSEAKKEIENLGLTLTIKVTDMAKATAAQAGRASSIGIVTEDLSDLTAKIADFYKIAVVEAPVDWPQGQALPGAGLYQKMREAERQGIAALPKTSAPVPKSYIEAFKQQLVLFGQVLCVTASIKISGSYNAALQARQTLEESERVTVIDSRQVASSQALVILRAIELIRQGWEIGDIAAGLEKYQAKIKSYIVVDDPKWLAAGGRISKTQADWIRRLNFLRLHLLITIKDGALAPGGIVFAKDKVGALSKKVAQDSQAIRAQGKRIRAVISHADDNASAKLLKRELKTKLDAEVSFVALASPALGVHGGPGTLMCAWTAI